MNSMKMNSVCSMKDISESMPVLIIKDFVNSEIKLYPRVIYRIIEVKYLVF